MLSVTDMFYTDRQEPVMVIEGDRSRSQRRGYLSRQDSRNFRSSASPPPSRSGHHASSWFGHRKSSQSPPRSRYYSYDNEYSDYRRSGYGRSPERSGRSWFSSSSGRRGSYSPPSSYHDSQSHTKYREDYTGYPQESGYAADTGYAPGTGYRTHGVYPSTGYVAPYSSDVYRGGSSVVVPSTVVVPTPVVVPRTYQTTYGSNNIYSNDYSESVRLKVPLCCEACEERITNHMLALVGVQSVTCDRLKEKVTVRGTASPSDILRQGRECFKQTKFY